MNKKGNITLTFLLLTAVVIMFMYTSRKSSGTNNTCTPSWSCSGWGECVGGVQTRSCSDLNGCGVQFDGSLSRSCSAACSNDCSPSGSRRCYSSTKYQTCGSYDSDTCLEWGQSKTCDNGYSCKDGDCVSEGPVCGNNQCEVGGGVDEYLSCPSDCGIVCGDGICNINPYDERVHCPQDCDFDDEPPPNDLVYKLQQKVRPLVGGIEISFEGKCTLGLVVERGGGEYILTAGHCITAGTDGMPDPADYGNEIYQGEEGVGTVSYISTSTGEHDMALVSIYKYIDSSKYQTFLGNHVQGFGTVYVGQKVYKIGRTTGLTYGTVFEITYLADMFNNLVGIYGVRGGEGVFAAAGDSGSAIITVDSPNKIVGVLTMCTSDGHECYSPMPEDIKTELGIDY